MNSTMAKVLDRFATPLKVAALSLACLLPSFSTASRAAEPELPPTNGALETLVEAGSRLVKISCYLDFLTVNATYDRLTKATKDLHEIGKMPGAVRDEAFKVQNTAQQAHGVAVSTFVKDFQKLTPVERDEFIRVNFSNPRVLLYEKVGNREVKFVEENGAAATLSVYEEIVKLMQLELELTTWLRVGKDGERAAKFEGIVKELQACMQEFRGSLEGEKSK